MDNFSHDPTRRFSHHHDGELALRHGASAPLPAAVVAAGGVGADQNLVAGLVRALKKRFWLALGLGLVCSAAATALAFVVVPRPKYTAAALLQVKATPPRMVFRTAHFESAMNDRLEFNNFKQTQEKLIKSRFVLTAALRDPKVSGLPSVRSKLDPVPWIEEELSVKFDGEVLSLSMYGKEPGEVVALVNAVTDAYLREVVNTERDERTERQTKLKETYERYLSLLKIKRDSLRKLASTAGSNDRTTLAYKQQIALERLGAAEKALVEVRADLRKAEAELATLPPEQPYTPAPPESYATALKANPQVLEMEANVASLRSKLDSARRLARSPADPAAQKLRGQYLAAAKNLEGYKQEVIAQLEANRQASSRQGRDEVRSELLRKIEFYKTFEKSQEEEVERLTGATKRSNETTLDLESLQEEIEQSNATVQKIKQEVDALDVELQAPERVRLLEKAVVPRMDGLKKQYGIIGMVGLASLATAFLGVAWRENRWRRVSCVEEVVHGIGINLLGVLPARGAGARPPARLNGTVNDYQENVLLESIDAARAALLRAARSGALRSVMVTSAQMGEGKSTLACHLATSLARARFRTLLIDCDLRRPTLHTVFDLPLGPGVSDFLRDEVDLFDALQPLGDTDLTVVTAGASDALAISALVGDRLPRFLERAKQRFDFVVIDSAPVLPVADSLHLCQHADAVVFAVLHDVSRVPKIQVAYERLSAFGARILGAVVAGVRIDHDETTYSYVGYQAGGLHEATEFTPK